MGLTWPQANIAVLSWAETWGRHMRDFDKDVREEEDGEQRPDATSAKPTNSQRGIFMRNREEEGRQSEIPWSKASQAN